MFGKILIANRGEIAVRIARTARRMGIATVAVYSDADRDALHIECCDQAIRIGAAPAAESYLCAPRIIKAALRSGAEAIHPGYGFLSENAEFSEVCARNDLVFIGPSADAIRAMGSKSDAKRIMHDAGVAVAPGYHGDDQAIETLRAQAEQVGYPLLIKATSGGGGKGMRLVEHAAQFEDALAAVQRESRASFADDRVLIEKYVPNARHVEVQIFADRHGDAVHLFDRDCSVQRRLQKVIEEAPAPGLDSDLRAQMGASAVAAAKAIDYVGAGTVEFLLDATVNAPKFYFMEMNTRLQVEHPVTEMITAQDLVEWQLRVAAGEPLPCEQDALRVTGHAIEARIYAENPANDFLPASGALAVYRPPSPRAWRRIDSGARQGDSISPHYDPMIAKLIAHGADRESARRRLRDALEKFDIAGVATNLAFAQAVIELDDFIKLRLDTGLIERNAATLFADPGDPPQRCLAAATLFWIQRAAAQARVGDDAFSPWSPSRGWQLHLPATTTCAFALASGEVEYQVRDHHGRSGERRSGAIDGATRELNLTEIGDGRFRFDCGESSHIVAIDRVADVIHLRIDGRRWSLPLARRTHDDAARDASADESAAHALVAPMPGAVIAVQVKEGARVARGASLLILEAMKMEHAIRAPRDGVVTRLRVACGDQVGEGDPLLTLEAIDAIDAPEAIDAPDAPEAIDTPTSK
ncbi:MAG: biotin carboxylase N-terminal domain-containing protein [bacterium]